jgi:hypothetical protein
VNAEETSTFQPDSGLVESIAKISPDVTSAIAESASSWSGPIELANDRTRVLPSARTDGRCILPVGEIVIWSDELLLDV